ncbi:hypothetical protein [Xylanibacter rodentium]|jgi:hypothetical protein|uniref:Uncharacterized protein n=1 Tax=Xylanibacter rodentium TaxID=2736289 RepID=A0ABX2AWP4_9BACT|nr:hypothetical protein [Xylanibacter rodentium]NPE10546.1 hypothetical protein [Prevotella sp. PJ1A]NPE15055.1 hypothetical protein [Xylanibacter rodentium]NPE38227.1 hypothetical protein [Prevotella sp. PCJ2]
MAKLSNWSDDYWLLLMQLYLRNPVGVKPMYSRPMVELSLELHIRPALLFTRMCAIANHETPYIEHLWETYGSNPRRLSAAVKRLRGMSGFCNAEAFYAGVNTVETFERDFRPICEDIDVIPVMLIMIIDLYFRLTPATMVPETPEVIELARVMRISPDVVNDVLQLYQHFDPYLSRPANLRLLSSPLMPACRTIWQRFGNSSIEGLASYARELKEFFL